MADSSFDTGAFTPPKNKVTVFTFTKEGEETNTFPVWKNVYGNIICFKAPRGFRKPGSLTLDNDDFQIWPSEGVQVKSGDYQICLSVAANSETPPGTHKVQFSFKADNKAFGYSYTNFPIVKLVV